MDGNIFDSKKERELQILRQRQASNRVVIDPNLRGFTQRYDPSFSRLRLLRLQRERIPTKAELERDIGVKTAKKLKKRRGKNLRGELAKNTRLQRRFERGERRDKPEQEPRIVGDPVAAAAEDPALQRRRLDLEEARDRQAALDRVAQRRADQATQERELAVRRGELAGARADRAAAAARLAAPPPADPEAQLRLAIEGRRISAQDAQQRRLVEALGEERGERGDLRKEIRVNLAQAIQEQGRVGALREAERLQERELLGERGERQRDRDREARTAEAVARAAADVQRDERERAERIAQTEAIAKERREELQAGGIERREESKQAREERTSRDKERRQDSAQSHQERLEIIDRLSRQQDLADPVEEERGLTASDREFLQRGLNQGLDTIDRRIGESENRTAEQIRQHADRVGRPEEDRPINISISNPPQIDRSTTGPTSDEIAQRVRTELEAVLSPRGRAGLVTRRLPIEEVSEEEDSPRRPPPSRTRSPSPESRPPSPADLPTDFDRPFGPIPGDEDPPSRTRPPPSRTRSPSPQRTGPPPSRTRSPSPSPPSSPRAPIRDVQPSGQIGLPGGDVDPFARDPTQDDFSQGGSRQTEEDEPADLPTDFDRPFGPLPGDVDTSVELDTSTLSTGIEPPISPISPIQEELFQSGQFLGDLSAAAENAIGFVGQAAGTAAGGISDIVFGSGKPEVGQQTGGILADPSGKPIFGLGQEIEPDEPTIQTLQSDEPERRKRYIGRDPKTGPPKQTLEQFQQERQDIFTQSLLNPGGTDAPADIEQELRVAVSELSALRRRNRGAGAGARAQAQASRSTGSFAGSKFAAKSGGVSPKDIKDAEENVRKIQQRVDNQREQQQIRDRIEASRQQGLNPQGFTTAGEGVTGGGLVEPVDPTTPAPPVTGSPQALLQEVAPVQPSQQRTNYQLFESLESEIDQSYTRGRPKGGARASLPFTITNLTDKKYKGLDPGQTVTLNQIESDGKLGYHPGSRTAGSKAGITRINRIELKRQIQNGKLKVDRKR